MNVCVDLRACVFIVCLPPCVALYLRAEPASVVCVRSKSQGTVSANQHRAADMPPCTRCHVSLITYTEKRSLLAMAKYQNPVFVAQGDNRDHHAECLTNDFKQICDILKLEVRLDRVICELPVLMLTHTNKNGL